MYVCIYCQSYCHSVCITSCLAIVVFLSLSLSLSLVRTDLWTACFAYLAPFSHPHCPLFPAFLCRRHSLAATYEDDIGDADLSRSQHGTGMSKNHVAKRFIAELERVSARTADNVFSQQTLFQIARDLQLPVNNIAEFIQTLNYQGYLLKRGNGTYKVMSAGGG